MTRTQSFFLALVVAASQTAAAQAPTSSIQIRKVRTLTDRDGRGFSRAPIFIARVRGGGFALVEVNELPIVIDSAGRFVKRLGGRGQGPGEFVFTAAQFRVGAGDTVFVNNRENISVFSPDLHFVRFVRASAGYVGDFVRTSDGFVVSYGAAAPGGFLTSFHVTDSAGNVLRSFGRDSLIPRARPEYSLSPASGSAFWAFQYNTHRLERWSTDGTRTTLIDHQPSWFVQRPDARGFVPRVRQVREAGGRLWVMSSVPVADAEAIMRKALGSGSGEVDGRRVPSEKMATARLEAYDVATGKLLADLPIAGFFVSFIDDSHFMLYSTNSDDLAQLEIWEMTFKP